MVGAGAPRVKLHRPWTGPVEKTYGAAPPMESTPRSIQDPIEAELRAGVLPRHVGIIMDGNGRWAERRGKPRIEGHREGSRSVREVSRTARRLGLGALTLYAFSAQNWGRPADEVGALMALLREYLESEREEIMTNGIRLNAIGDLDKLPRYVRNPLEALRAESAGNQGMVLTLALSYGGREELLRAASQLAGRMVRGELKEGEVSESDFEAALWTHDLPQLDLIIRTSGEQRISNFLLWQAAYAELMFVDTLWPEFRREAFLDCLLHFQGRERRFGLTAAQLPQAAQS
jgi:undecaprenyl diphosphate synthase